MSSIIGHFCYMIKLLLATRGLCHNNHLHVEEQNCSPLLHRQTLLEMLSHELILAETFDLERLQVELDVDLC